MKNTLKSMFNKVVVSGMAVLGLGGAASVAQAQQVVCTTSLLSAQQIYSAEYNRQTQACSTVFNYQSRQACQNNATITYNNNLASHPDPYTARYCAPGSTVTQQAPIIIHQPAPVLPSSPVYVTPQVDPGLAILGAIIIGGAIYHHNTHNDHRHVMPPRHQPPHHRIDPPRHRDRDFHDRGRGHDNRGDRHHRGPGRW